MLQEVRMIAIVSRSTAVILDHADAQGHLEPGCHNLDGLPDFVYSARGDFGLFWAVHSQVDGNVL